MGRAVLCLSRTWPGKSGIMRWGIAENMCQAVLILPIIAGFISDQPTVPVSIEVVKYSLFRTPIRSVFATLTWRVQQCFHDHDSLSASALLPRNQRWKQGSLHGDSQDADAKNTRLRKYINDISAGQYPVFREDPYGAGGNGSPFRGEVSGRATQEWCSSPSPAASLRSVSPVKAYPPDF